MGEAKNIYFTCLKEGQKEQSKMADRKLGFAENFALSGVAAVVSKTAAAPIERIKLLVQNQDEMIRQGRLDKPYNGVVDCTVRTIKSEGVYPLWRGNLANCLRYFPTQALNFAFKDKVKAAFNVQKDASYAKKFTANILSGGCAGSLSLLFVYSLDYARTRLANDAKGKGGERQYKGLIDVYAKTLKSDGIQGLYRIRHLLRRNLRLPWNVLRSLRFSEAHSLGTRCRVVPVLLLGIRCHRHFRPDVLPH